MKKFLMYGALVTLALGMTACSDDDPTSGYVEPPVVSKAPNTISGLVTNMQGEPIEGATVKLGSKTVTTDANGVYVFDDVDAGSYDVTVSATGMVSQTQKVVVASGDKTQKLSQSFSLADANNVGKIDVIVATGGEGAVESEAIKGNNEGEVKISLTAPAQSVPANTQITITPIYKAEDAARSEEEAMLIGATLACTGGNVTLSNDIDLKFAVDPSVSASVITKKYVNNTWVPVESKVVGDNVVISTRDFTSYGLFFKVDMNVTTGSEGIVFDRSEWNNLNGSTYLPVSEAAFNYNLGTRFTATATNNLEGLLIELIARIYGPTTATARGVYPLNVTLPAGTALSIRGAQYYNTVTAKAAGRSVSAKNYGTVDVSVITYNRDHEGGSNIPNM